MGPDESSTAPARGLENGFSRNGDRALGVPTPILRPGVMSGAPLGARIIPIGEAGWVNRPVESCLTIVGILVESEFSGGYRRVASSTWILRVLRYSVSRSISS